MLDKGVEAFDGLWKKASILCQCCLFKGRWEDSTHDYVFIGVETSLRECHTLILSRDYCL